MKRVLNSGTIKLPYVTGTEQDVINWFNNNWTTDMLFERATTEYASDPYGIQRVVFTFEIKAPLLTFLAFQDSNLGTLNRLAELDHPIAYLPPQFYTKDISGYTSMDGKNCNIYTTKLFNFYRAAFNFYNNLLKEGMCKEEASLVLPQGVFVNFLWKINALDLVNYIEKHHTDSPEIYGYCSTLVLYLQEHMPKFTNWLKVNKWKTLSL